MHKNSINLNDGYAGDRGDYYFSNYWVFVCLKTEIAKKNDYIKKTIAGKSVIVRNDGENYRAFENKCPHRNAQLVLDDTGNGYLKCPFHGWGFRADGALAGIPYNKEMYGLTEIECQKISLNKISIVTIGKFIFINLSQNPIKIEDQFAPEMLEDLKKISPHIDANYTTTKIFAKCNWKLIMEIVMDPLHIPFVHPSTISTKRPFTPPPLSAFPDQEFEYKNVRELSYKTATPLPHENENWHSMVDDYPVKGNYLDYYFFPNLHFMVPTGGFSFAYCAQFPAKSNRTNINYFYTTAKRKIKHRIFQVVHSEAIGFGLRTFLEDVAMMENVQNSADLSKLSGVFGRYDLHIKAWRNFFDKDPK
jgi:carnitine monooxygenase subunit